MNFMAYYPIDVVNGPGTRVSLFVSGCSLACPGCFQKKSHNPNAGAAFDKKMEDQVLNDLKDTRIPKAGISILGGDPLEMYNVPFVLALVKRIKKELPDKTIWLWTGRTIDELNKEQLQVIDFVDTLIDGPFVQALYDPNLIYTGSKNQQVIKITNR